LPVALAVRLCQRLYSAVPYIRGAPFHEIPTLDHSTNTRLAIQPIPTRRSDPEGRRPATTVACTAAWRTGIGLLRFRTKAVSLFGRSHPLLLSRLGFSPTPSVSLRGDYPGEHISGHPRDLVESAVPGCGKVVGTSSVPLARESHSRRDASPLPPSRVGI